MIGSRVARVALALGALMLAQCTKPRTELVVTVRSELAWGAGRDLQSLVVTVRREGPNGAIRWQQSKVLGSDVGQWPLPLSFGLYPSDASDATPVWIEVLGCAERDGCVASGALVVQRAVVSYRPEQTVGLDVWLAARCRGVMCIASETCAQETGTCVSARSRDVDVRPLPGGSVPTGTDAEDGSVDVVTKDDALVDAAMAADAPADSVGTDEDMLAVDGATMDADSAMNVDVPTADQMMTDTDVPVPDVVVPVDVLPDIAPSIDVSAAVDAFLDTPMPLDGMSDGAVPMDVAADVRTDAPVDALRDVLDVLPLPPCGDRGQPCCGVTGRSDVVCRNGLLCNAFSRGTCVDVTREPGECQPVTGCSGSNVCSGPTGCGDRWCYRCQPRGTLAYDAVCNPDLGGTDCASGVCQRGRCTYACSVGNAGDAECTRLAPGSRCIATVYGLDLDGGTPSRWTTLGSCAPGCARASDCTGGRACIATMNLAEDRFDFICSATVRTDGPGAACSSMGTNTCQSGLCIPTTTTAGVCMAPCTADGDCPSGLLCQPAVLTRPVSGTTYEVRGCLPPCRSGETRCGGACVNTQSDAMNCGGCGRSCGGFCSGGTCLPPCNPGETRCGSVCANLATSPYHCGMCGNACGGSRICRSGACV